MQNRPASPPIPGNKTVRIVLIYAVFAGLWIFFSDRAVPLLSNSPEDWIWINTHKGWFFVAITSALLYFLLNRHWRAYEAVVNQQIHALRLTETITNSSKDAVFAKDLDGKYILFNQAAANFVGKPVASVLGRDDFDLFPQAQAETLQATNQRIIATGATETVEELLDTPNGKVCFHVTKGPLVNPDKSIYGTFGIARDLTDRYQAEQALRDSESRFRSLYTAMVEGVALHELVLNEAGDPVDYRILDVNPAYSTILGISRETVIGQLASTVYQLTPPPYLATYAQVIQRQEPVRFETTFEPLARSFLITAFSPQDNQFATVFEDITERIQTERILAEAKTKAEAANIAKSHFLATMSHEIRTPLNGILGTAQLLAMSEISESERQEFAQTILNSGHNLLALLNSLLDFSRMEAGRLSLTLKPINLSLIAQDVAHLFREPARAKGLLLEINPGFPDETFEGDELRLRQMLSNLVSNAIKFTDTGRISLGCRELARHADHVSLEISVTDTGIGIPNNKHTQLFAPFTQLDNATSRQYEGAGLGLSIVKSLAELMGGDVGLSSSPGHGSCFWFTCQLGTLPNQE